jgi:hypothetical protein
MCRTARLLWQAPLLFIPADGAMFGIRGAHMSAPSAYFSARMPHVEAVIFDFAFISAPPCL